VLGTQRTQLLVIGHPRRQRGQVPVQMSVALLAAQAQRVHPLGRHDRGQRPGHPVHDPLQGQELRLVQVVTQISTWCLGATRQWPSSVGQRARNAMASASS